MAHVHNLLEALQKLNKHHKKNFNRVTRFPLHFICSSWMPQMRKLPTCQSQRGGRYQYHPKSQCRPQGWCQLSHEKTSAQCLKCRRTMSQHHTYSSQEGDITPTAPLFVKTWVFPQNALMHSRYPLFLCWKSSVSIKKLFRINDAPAAALCLTVDSNKAVIKCEPCSPFLFSPYPLFQSCSYKGGIISCSCIPQSRRREISLCLLSRKYK